MLSTDREFRANLGREAGKPFVSWKVLQEPGQPVDITSPIRRRQVVHGLINEYRRAA